MEISTEQYQRILARLRALETAHNDIVTAIQQFVTLQQVQELLTITSADLAEVTEQITALEDRVTSIEEEPLR